MLDEIYLSSLQRKQLQALAKENGLKANASSADLIKALLSLKDNRAIDINVHSTKDREFQECSSENVPDCENFSPKTVSKLCPQSNFKATTPSLIPKTPISEKKSSLKARFATPILNLQNSPLSDEDSPKPSGSTAKKIARTSLGRMRKINTPLVEVVNKLNATEIIVSADQSSTKSPKVPTGSSRRKSSGKKRKSAGMKGSPSSPEASSPAEAIASSISASNENINATPASEHPSTRFESQESPTPNAEGQLFEHANLQSHMEREAAPRESIEAWAAVLDDEDACWMPKDNARGIHHRLHDNRSNTEVEMSSSGHAVRFTPAVPGSQRTSLTPTRLIARHHWNSSTKTSLSAGKNRPATAGAEPARRHSLDLNAARRLSSSSVPSTPTATASKRAQTPKSARHSYHPGDTSTAPLQPSPQSTQISQSLTEKLSMYLKPANVDTFNAPAAAVPAPKMTKAAQLMMAARQAKAADIERVQLEHTLAARPGLVLATHKRSSTSVESTKTSIQPRSSTAAGPSAPVSKPATKHVMVPACASVKPTPRPAEPEVPAFKARSMPTFKAVAVAMNKAAVVAAAAVAAPKPAGGFGKPAAAIPIVSAAPAHRPSAQDAKENIATSTTTKRISAGPFKLSTSNRGAAKTGAISSSDSIKAAPLSPVPNAMDNTRTKPRRGQKTPCKNPFEEIAL